MAMVSDYQPTVILLSPLPPSWGTCWAVTTQEGTAIGLQYIEAKDAAEHGSVPRTALPPPTAKNHLAPNVSGTTIEKPQEREKTNSHSLNV